MKICLSTLIFTVGIVFSTFVWGQNIVQFRGPERNGMYPETGLLNSWPAEGPQLLWETDTLGFGYGSPVIYDDKLFVNGEIDTISQLFAFDLKGNLLWTAPNGREFVGDGFSAGFPGSRSTPTICDGFAYIHSGLGRIACIDIRTRKEVWSKNMVADFGGALNYFGFSESFLIDGNKLFCYPGGTENNVVCLNRLTGDLIWSSKAVSQNAAFCSPILISLPERKLFVTTSKDILFALDAQNGELLWSVQEDSAKYDDEYCNTPVWYNGYLYSVPGMEKCKGAVKLKLSPDGKTVEEVWRNADAKNLMNGFIITGNNLYVTSKNKKLWRINTDTGIASDTLRNLNGSLVCADSKLICYTDNGNVNLIDISKPNMEVTGKFPIKKGTKEHLAYPLVKDGILYIRHGNILQAYSIK